MVFASVAKRKRNCENPVVGVPAEKKQTGCIESV
jgi:hypothetical protein